MILLLLILTYALFASAFSCNRLILQISSPIFAAGIRTFIGGLILCLYSFGTNRHKKYFSLTKTDIYALIQIIIFNVALQAILKNIALKNMSSIKTGFFGNFDPFMAALFAYFLFSEKLSLKKWLGMIVAFSGALIFLLIKPGEPLEKALGEFARLSWPELCIILSLASSRFGWFKIQYMIRDRKFSSPLVIGISMIIGGLLALIGSFILECSPRITNLPNFLFYLTYIVLSSNVIGYVLYAYLHKKHSGTLISLVGFSQPLFVALYGVIFLKEQISSYFFISTIIVL